MIRSTTPRLAIIGVGPRALGALEALARQTGGWAAPVEVDLFDPLAWPGAGPNFRPDDSPLCLLNIPLRAIDIGSADRTGAAFGDLRDWLGEAGGDEDRFPSRAELGAYLAARMAALIAQAPQGLALCHHDRRVDRVAREAGGWWLETQQGREGPYDEVLLAQGQPATAPDKQMARWQDHAAGCGADLLPAYPAHRLLEAAQGWAGRQVAIRGLGLSTLDVLRLLTCGLGGRFDAGGYRRSGREPARILPFSLDGHAPVAKPATAALDARFDPREDETARFLEHLQQATAQPTDQAVATICAAFEAPAARILRDCESEATAMDVRRWLAQERDAPGGQETRSATEALRAGMDEATGRVPPSPGYVVGQLCRKWQNALRQGFNPARIPVATAAAIIGFDEGLKRYSYGPPLSSARELLALIEAGIVDPRAAEDPDIRLTEDGWQLVEEDLTARVTAMVDAVLPSPDLSRLTDPLMAGLLAEGRVTGCGEGLAARVLPDGRLIGKDDQPQPGLCLLGRLALGSVIAVDSVHDCFGAAADRWAGGVTTRLRGQAPA